MNRGKEICKELKAVRRKIAAENDIPLDIPECPHKGPCPGTCPRCEAEVRYLENALASRISMGKVATVAGLALTLAAPAAVQAQEPVRKNTTEVRTPQAKLLPVQGTIIDSKTKEPLPFVNVSFTPTGETVKLTVPKFAVTDFDGIYKLELPEGDYTMRVAFIGYQSVEQDVRVSASSDTIDLSMESGAMILGAIPVLIEGGSSPIIELGPEGGMHTEVQGVPLIIQY